MSAGVPNYQRLAEMGKLPKESRHQVPYLGQLDDAEKEIERIKSLVCDECKAKIFSKAKDDAVVESKCEVDGCDFVAKGKSLAVANNNLRLHSKSHEAKENKEETKA